MSTWIADFRCWTFPEDPFSSPEPTILLACGRNRRALGATISGMRHRTKTLRLHSRPQSLRSFWPAAGIESSEITKEITEFCPSGFTAQSASMAHAWNGCSQSSRFWPLVKGNEDSGDEIAEIVNLTNWRQFFMRLSCYWSWISSSHCQSSCGSTRR